MMYLRLHENGPEFPIGHDLLLGLARNAGPATRTLLLPCWSSVSRP